VQMLPGVCNPLQGLDKCMDDSGCGIFWSFSVFMRVRQGPLKTMILYCVDNLLFGCSRAFYGSAVVLSMN